MRYKGQQNTSKVKARLLKTKTFHGYVKGFKSNAKAKARVFMASTRH